MRNLDPSLFLNLYKTLAVWLQLVACLFVVCIDEDSVMGALFQEIILLFDCNCHLASDYLVGVGETH